MYLLKPDSYQITSATAKNGVYTVNLSRQVQSVTKTVSGLFFTAKMPGCKPGHSLTVTYADGRFNYLPFDSRKERDQALKEINDFLLNL